MLAIRESEEVPEPAAERFVVNLTEDVSEEPQRRLRAVSADGAEGHWTMVFDEGFEVRMPPTTHPVLRPLLGADPERSFFAHFFFRAVEDTKRSPSNGDRWEDIAEYHGRREDQIRLQPRGSLYACHCDRTSVGWWHRRSSEGAVIESGCFWGRKLGGGGAEQASLIRLLSRPSASAPPPPSAGDRDHDHQLGLIHRHNGTAAAAAVAELQFVDLGAVRADKEVLYVPRNGSADVPGKRVAADVQTGTRLLRAGRGAGAAGADGDLHPADLPKAWDWRAELAGMWRDGRDGLSEQFDQGNCGSCYAFSGAMVLQMRFRIQLLKRHGLLYPLELSWRSATRCSPYTEGCNGGFAYLTFKYAAEAGLPLAQCDQFVRAEDLDRSCDWSCYQNSSMLFYAKDYGQTGGFSHGASEEAILREMYHNGPVIVSIATTAAPEFIYNNGESWVNDTSVMTGFLNHKVPEEPFSRNPTIHPWRYTTHSILAVGWGEEQTASGDVVKYWIVRNSWGTDWGTNGYAKMRRGNNDAALESCAPWVQPDLDRLPPGFLEIARRRHDAEVAARAGGGGGSAAEAGAGAASAARSGRPAYCKLRPDSPDCH